MEKAVLSLHRKYIAFIFSDFYRRDNEMDSDIGNDRADFYVLFFLFRTFRFSDELYKGERQVNL